MKKIGVLAVLLTLSLLYFFSCGTSGGSGGDGTVKINYSENRQVIDGFGGSDAWSRLPRDREAAKELVTLLYSKTEGAGFTILRNRVPFRERLAGDDNPGNNDGFVVRKSDDTYDFTANANGTKTFNLNWNNWDLAATKSLIEYIDDLGNDGPEKLVIMSTPWTPPNNRVTQWKQDVTGVSGRLDGRIDWSKPEIWGRLKRDKFEDYADLLADYVLNFEARMGAPLDILSIQNEPNWKVQYESAYWSGEDFRDFLAVAAQRFPRKGITLGEGGKIGIMIPEFENFDIDFNSVIKPSLDVPAVNRIITHIALHQYNGAYDSSPRAGAKAFPDITATGKRFWQTEVSGSGPQLPAGIGIDNALYYARMIHFDFTLVGMNAYLFWWLWTGSNDVAGSLVKVDGDHLTPAKRLYAMGQYSRFIRPGWNRIDSDVEPATGVYSSAYRNPKTDEIAVVIINDRASARSVSLDLQGASFSELALWRTSHNENLKSIGRQRTSGGAAVVDLPPKSISTFYGRVR